MIYIRVTRYLWFHFFMKDVWLMFFFTWSVTSSLEESKLTSRFLLLRLNWISAKEEKKNLAETNFSDQRRRQDDICHSILNKISFICIMTYRHSVWCKKITPSLSKIEEVLSYKFYTSFSVHARCWSKTCKVTLGFKNIVKIVIIFFRIRIYLSIILY